MAALEPDPDQPLRFVRSHRRDHRWHTNLIPAVNERTFDLRGRICAGWSGRARCFPILDVVPREQDCPMDRYPAIAGNGAAVGRHFLWFTMGTHVKLLEVGPSDDGRGPVRNHCLTISVWSI